MRIMVFDVPAESGGALSVLHEFYDEYKTDNSNEYIFIVSKPEIQEASNIKVLRFPWIKKSWIHRLYFDHFIAPKLITKYKVDRVLSLQNIMIPHTKAYQTVFVHNALPFSEHRFSIFNNRLLWVYQNILSRSIYNSIRRADRVIVQTNWVRDVCVKKLNVNSDKFDVIPPKINIQVDETFQKTKGSVSTFFYPASGVVFKNHNVIVDACLNLKEQGITDYKVIFTLSCNENKQIRKLFDLVKKYELPIYFIGHLTREKVFNYYKNSILIFPSYIETVGLPLAEAKQYNTIILSSNCVYAKSILEDYQLVHYFKYDSSKELSGLMIKCLHSYR